MTSLSTFSHWQMKPATADAVGQTSKPNISTSGGTGSSGCGPKIGQYWQRLKSSQTVYNRLPALCKISAASATIDQSLARADIPLCAWASRPLAGFDCGALGRCSDGIHLQVEIRARQLQRLPRSCINTESLKT